MLQISSPTLRQLSIQKSRFLAGSNQAIRSQIMSRLVINTNRPLEIGLFNPMHFINGQMAPGCLYGLMESPELVKQFSVRPSSNMSKNYVYTILIDKSPVSTLVSVILRNKQLLVCFVQ